MSENKGAMRHDWVDEDDAPELEEAWFESATMKMGDRAILRGEDLVALDPEIAAYFRSHASDGSHWHQAVNEALRRAIREDIG